MPFNPAAHVRSHGISLEADLANYVQSVIAAYDSYSQGQSHAQPVIASQNIGTALTLDLQNQSGQLIQVTATNNGSITFANLVAGATWTVQHQQNATGGWRTIFNGITWLAGAGAVSPTANALDIFTFYTPDGIVVYGFQATTPVYGAPTPSQTSQVIETGPRIYETNARAVVAGTLYVRHFRPDHDLLVSNLQSACAGTAAAGATLAKMGLAVYGGSGSYTTIARTASDTTLWSAVTYYRRAIVDDGAATPNSISSVQLKAGVEYAFLILGVGWTTAPQIAGVTVNVLSLTDSSAKMPRIASSLTAQTNIPATFTTNTGTASVLWGACD